MPNDGRARDHLANERTYLAWLRTGLAVVAAGAALARFSGDNLPGAAAAAAITVAIGVGIIGQGTRRYYQVAREMDRGEFTPSRASPLIVSVVVVAAGAIVLALLLARV